MPPPQRRNLHRFGDDGDDDGNNNNGGGAQKKHSFSFVSSKPAAIKAPPAVAVKTPPRTPPGTPPPRSPVAAAEWRAPPASHVGAALTPEQVRAAVACKRARLLGAGGFGKVYAVDLPPPIGRAAVKLAAPGGERALAAEALHLRRCAHPAVVRALASCWAPGAPALVVELVAGGGSLDGRIGVVSGDSGGNEPAHHSGGSTRGKRAPLTWRERVRVAYQVAAALHHLHDALHVCHCDVKPGNVLLDAACNATLIDFGVARPVVGDSAAAAAATAAAAAAAPKAGAAAAVAGAGGGLARSPPAAAFGPRSPGTGAHHRGVSGSSGGGGGGDDAAAHLRSLAAGLAAGSVAQLHGWAGTEGYGDPLFVQLGQLCERSDVYSLGVVMAQLLLDRDEPLEARRMAQHQVKSRELHLPAHLAREWPPASALAFGALALRCCNGTDRDARPPSRDVAAELRALLLAAGDAGVARLCAGTLKLAAAVPSAAAASSDAAAAAAAPAAAAAKGAAKVAALQLELAAGGAVTGVATLQLPQPPLPPGGRAAAAEAAMHPGPEPVRVAVLGEWDAATGGLRLRLAVPPPPSAAAQQQLATAAAAAAAAGAGAAPPVRLWPVEFAGAYADAALSGKWTLSAAARQVVAAAASQPAHKGAARPTAAAAAATAEVPARMHFIAFKPPPATAVAAAGSGASGGGGAVVAAAGIEALSIGGGPNKRA